jgi:ubiquinone/menaquinone biosynthesis C-methylase UbiE
VPRVAGRDQDDVWEMSEESAPGKPWKKKLLAWWEGYDLPKEKAEAHEPEPAVAAEAPAGNKPVLTGVTSRFGKPLWSASRIQVVEKLWGEGFTTPGGDDYIPQLVKPLGLNPAMSVLDLAAGLGGAGRKMAAQYGCWVTGMEPSPILAKEGMERSVKAGMAKQATIVHYDPENFKHPKRFDCIFAKEAFCFVKNREVLHDGIELSLKPRGQLLFTDYVFDKEEPRSAAIKDWVAKEPVEPFPLTMQQTINSLQQRNLDIRINEDITDAHRTLILAAIQSLTEFLQNRSLDHDTKLAVVEEVEQWARRVAALQSGLRAYRFFALKLADGSEG